jgi:hypothetical protein
VTLADFFCSFVAEKVGCGGGDVFCCFWAFLRGVLGKVVCRCGVFCGEFVVGCVANVDKKTTLCGG